MCFPQTSSSIAETTSTSNLTVTSDDNDSAQPVDMIPGLPDIKMLDSEALSDLLEDNLSPPEITSILVFATNGAIFAYASSLPAWRLRNLAATYGAAYTCYAKNVSSGNLTGVNPASHPSSYVTKPSVSLGDVGSIVFELDDLVAVVTKVADKVLLAAVGSSKLDREGDNTGAPSDTQAANGPADGSALIGEAFPSPTVPTTSTNGTAFSTKMATTPSNLPGSTNANANSDIVLSSRTSAGEDSVNTLSFDPYLEAQYEIDRSIDLARLASLNLSTSPAILLALESKSAALGRFLSQKLEDLQSPEDF